MKNKEITIDSMKDDLRGRHVHASTEKEIDKNDAVLNHTRRPADVRESFGSAPSQSRGAPGITEKVVDGHYYRSLLQAAFKGDWESAERFFDQDSASKTAKITSRSETVLHIAAWSAQDQFLENLVELLSPYPKALEEVDCDVRTALHNAVLCGRIRMVKTLVTRNPNLTQLPDKKGYVPLEISARESSMHKEIAWFLAKNTTDDGPSHPFSNPAAISPIIDLTFAGHHDITLYLVGRYPHLITMKSGKDKDISILQVLALMPSHFLSGTRLGVLEALIYKCIPVDLNYKTTYGNSRITQTSTELAVQYLTRSLWDAAKTLVPKIKQVHEVKLRHMTGVELAKQVCIAVSYMKTTNITKFFEDGDLLGQATSKGISELLKLCIQFFPELIWTSPYGSRLMIYAVEYRQERILRLFIKVSSTNELSLIPAPTEEESEGLMLAVAKYEPKFGAATKVSGAAFRMQRELQWYKAVERWVFPSVRNAKSKEKEHKEKRYWQIFLEEHQKLLENGEKWTKDTANSCMLVSTLITTVLFAAAFTVPGGNNGYTGVPLLLGHDSLLVFAISDALGMFSSVMAILLFLAILTSQYEPEDFHESLPKKIIMGLSLLFLSLAFMLVAFAATFKIVLDERLQWIFIPIIWLTSLPVVLFVLLQLPLLFQMVKSTYGPSIFHPESIWE